MRKKVSMILLYGLVFLTPFLFSTNTNELFEFPKMYFVYFAGSLLFVVMTLGRLGKTGKSNVSMLMGLFAASFILSTIFSSHPHTSLWGYFSRFNGGLISVIIFFGIYLSTLCLKPSIREVLKLLAFTMIPISIYSVMQHLGFGGSWATDTTVRAFSTFGQPNWYGAYCAMILPIILYFASEDKNRIGWYLLYILGFTGFWFSYSVSGIIGLVVSTVVGFLLNIKSTKNSLLPIILTLSSCLGVALLNPGIFKQKLDDAIVDLQVQNEKINETKEVTETSRSYAITDSGFIRVGIWQGAINLWVSSPKNFLLGTGPETFPYEFQKFRPASLNYSSEWNFILNKPHNYYLELLTQNGLLGLLIYLAIIVKVVLAKHPMLTPALVGFFVTNIFGWPTVSTTLLFWIFLALVTNADNDGGRGAAKHRFASVLTTPLPPLTSSIVFSIILLALYGYVNIQFAKHYLADVASKASNSYFETGEIQKALALSNKAINLNPQEPFYYRQHAKTYLLTTVGQSADQITHTKTRALVDILTAQDLNPRSLATLRGELPLYYFLALTDLSATAKELPQANQSDPFYLEIARSYYQKLAKNYPNDVGVQAQIAKYQKMLGFADDYSNTVANIKKLRPDLLEWYLK